MLSRFYIPDTVNYMIAGYTVFVVVISAYLASIFARWARTKREYLEFQERETKK